MSTKFNTLNITPIIFTTLGLNTVEGRLYTALVTSGPSSVATITQRAGIQRTSAYYMLNKLEKLGLVHATVRRGKRPEYYAEKPETLLSLYDQHLATLASERKNVKAAVHELTDQYALTAVTPKVQFDRGVAGIKRVMMEAVSGKYKEVLNIMPLDTMLDIVGVEWFGKLMETQVKNEVHVKVLRVYEKMRRQSELPRVDPDTTNLWRERRVLPRSLNFDITLWIYGDTFSFFSSQRELYAMTIHSAEMADMQRKTFAYFWAISNRL